MTAIPQNLAIVGWAVQSALGSPASASAHRVYLIGGQQLHAEIVKTNSGELHGYQSPMEAFHASAEGKGAPEIYVMPSSIASLLYGIFGAKQKTGASDPYQWDLTEATEIPYFTVWGAVGGGLYEKFVDCKLQELVIKGSEGGRLTAIPTFVGGSPSFLSAAETTATLEKGDRMLFYDGKAALQVGGAPVRLMSDFEFKLNRGTTPIQGDSFTPADSLVGPLALTVAVTATPSTFGEYNEVVYGSASPSGSATPAIEPIAITSGIDLLFTRVAASPGPKRSLQLVVPNIQRDPFVDALNATPGPLKRSTNYMAYKPSDGSTIATATVFNGDTALT